MAARIALLVRIAPRPGGEAELQASDLSRETFELARRPIAVKRPIAFLLTIEAEPGRTFAHGQLRSLPDGAIFPLRSSAALFDLLRGWTADPPSDVDTCG